MKKLFVLAALVAVAMCIPLPVHAVPPLTGTFYMNDTNASPEAIQKAVTEMASTGMNTIIILAAGYLNKPNNTITQCQPIPGCQTSGTYEECHYLSNTSNTTGYVMQYAARAGMDIYIGLAAYDLSCVRHWIGTPDDPNTDQGRLIDFSLRLMDEINTYAVSQGIPADRLKGYYLGETGPANLATPTVNELVFWKYLSQRMKAKAPDKKIMISPYVFQENTYDYMKSVYENVYRQTPIDIIAPQDSMGTRKVTTYIKSAELYRALRDATASFPGRQAWANIETQLQPTADNGDYNPSTIDRVSRQILAAQPYVTKLVTWIYQHTMLSAPEFDSLYSWTGQYTPARAAMRRQLRSDYLSLFSSPDLAAVFIDVPTDHWAYPSIDTVVKQNIASGCQASPPLYCPDAQLTRAQAAVFLLKSKYGGAYIPPPVGSSTGFTDVPVTHWAAAWIKQLVAEGITGGCTATTFCPDNPVTRAQAAVFLLKTKYGPSHIPPAATGVFTDVLVSHWAAAWIEQLYRENIVSGCNTNPLQFCPETTVTRASIAVLVVKAFNLSAPSPTPLHVSSTPTRTRTPTRTPTGQQPSPTQAFGICEIPGDLTGDGHVDIFDYNILVANFGKIGPPGFTPADINTDGSVDIFDYNILVGNFGM